MTPNLTPNRHDYCRQTWLAALLALAVIASQSSAHAQDTTPPTVNSVTVFNSGYSIEVQFSEPMDLVLAGDPLNYSVDGSITPHWAIISFFQPYVVTLEFNIPIVPGTHQLIISPNVTDQSGNPLASFPDPTVVPFTWNPPVLTSAVANCSGTELTATFSVPVEVNLGSDPFNYQVFDAAEIYVISAVLSADNQTATITLDPPLVPGESYYLVASYIPDASGQYYIVNQSIPVQFPPIPPAVNCSVATSSLFPVNNALVDVGLSATSSASDLQVQVFSDEPEVLVLQDAELAGGVLQLRARRNPGSDGRVYLIVVTSTDACGNVGVCCSTVVVPKNSGAAALASVQAQAAAAQAQCSASGSPLTPYQILP